jgi:hypothetical protein
MGPLTTLAAGIVWLAAAAAAARPIAFDRQRARIADDLTLVLRRDRLEIVRGKQRAPIDVGGDGWTPLDFSAVAGSPDGAAFDVTIADNCGAAHALHLTRAGLEARLANSAALALHRRGSWGAAADGFARALALDPTFDWAATNLASAQVQLGKRDEAARTVTGFMAKSRAAIYARLLSDPQLAPLLDHPSVAAMRAQPAGTARLRLGDNDVRLAGGPFAISMQQGLIAAVHSEASWGICKSLAELVVLDFSGAEQLRMPLYAMDETTDDEPKDCPIARRALPRVRARVAAAQRLLVDLGFTPADGQGGAEKGVVSSGAGSGAARASFPKGKLGLVLGRSAARVLRGDRELGTVAVEATSIDAATYLAFSPALAPPAQGLIVFSWARGAREGCEGSDPTGIKVVGVRPP